MPDKLPTATSALVFTIHSRHAVSGGPVKSTRALFTGTVTAAKAQALTVAEALQTAGNANAVVYVQRSAAVFLGHWSFRATRSSPTAITWGHPDIVGNDKFD